MECNKLFYTDQYGFRPGHSTELAAARFVNELAVDMDNYKIPTSVFIDLSKAFDTLNHDILISKLKHYGVFGVELKIVSSYLSDRVQYINLCKIYHYIQLKRGATSFIYYFKKIEKNNT